jgi:hypothetical protein
MIKYFKDYLSTDKLNILINHYPTLDNFKLNWNWWTYKTNRELERLYNDPLISAGSIPWLNQIENYGEQIDFINDENYKPDNLKEKKKRN